MTVTVLTPGSDKVTLEADGGGSVEVDSAQLEVLTGYTLSPEGLCEGATCVPLDNDGAVDLVTAAGRLGRRVVVDADRSLIALGVPAERRAQAIEHGRAPDFTLPDLDGRLHSLEEWDGRKRLLFAFSSW